MCAAKEKQKSKPSMAAFFEEILAERKLVSVLSDKSLECFMEKKSFRYSCCAHVLSKKKYPELAYAKENIALLTPHEHLLYDMGTIEQREAYARENHCDWSVLEKIKENLLSA